MLSIIQPDEELLSRYQGGDDRAFETLYRRHRKRLWGLARKMAWVVQQAEDILVEAVAAVAVAARQGRIEGSFVGYALTAVHHRGLHVIDRSNEKRSRGTVPLTLGLVSAGPSPEETLMLQAERSEVASELDALPREEGTAVFLVDAHGLTYREAAQALSCSEATVKRRLREGRRNLADRLRHLRPEARAEEG